ALIRAAGELEHERLAPFLAEGERGHGRVGHDLVCQAANGQPVTRGWVEIGHKVPLLSRFIVLQLVSPARGSAATPAPRRRASRSRRSALRCPSPPARGSSAYPRAAPRRGGAARGGTPAPS